ncbi:MAG: DNA topoisomerase 4 subunit A [Anaerolineaceae bacterium]|nr:DNA topoisomerase 4 subunit A [Anaerolineaceae bacterium]
MEIGKVSMVDIDSEMRQSYLDYAMSVIVARALPDARDGLKPVQRRILYAMYDMGIRPNSSFKKSARIVGEVLGKYHPHGDMAVYEAMARLAQEFSIRYPLVDGQGNFGSIDGDPPAAMRYTEARLLPFAFESLAQIEKNTVNFARNFDDTLDEPEVLPASIPNLLVNGATGIAVGMATSIPPHNLGEVVDALIYMLKRWNQYDNIAVSDLMTFIKGPDFPTAGIILQEEGKISLLETYGKGRGRVTVRGRVHLEEMSRGRTRLIISELPFMTNKASLIEKIASLVRESKDGEFEISDLRDESDRHGMRIVIELKSTADADQVLRSLYRRTSLQSTFSISLLALVGGEPRLLTIKQALRVYLEHRLEVVQRRSVHDLAKAKDRAHILEGLLVALKNLDVVINLIRKSSTAEIAMKKLMSQFRLSKVQAQAILDMPLRRLASLERKKIEQEHKGLLRLIKELESLLGSPLKIRRVIEKELLEAKEQYGDPRRTQIVHLAEGESALDLLTASDLTPTKTVWVGITKDGLIGRTLDDNLPRVSGKEAPAFVVRTTTHQALYIVGENGQAASMYVDSLPEVERFSVGSALTKATAFRSESLVASVFTIPQRSELEEGDERFVMTSSEAGMVKKTSIDDLPGVSSDMFTLVKVNKGDRLIDVTITNGETDVLLVTASGMAIRFKEVEVRPMGLVAAGVGGIKLREGDRVVGFDQIIDGGMVMLLASDGFAWRISESEFPQQGRYGQGTIACRLSSGANLAGVICSKYLGHDGIAHFKKAAARMIAVGDAVETKRARVGKETLQVKEKDAVIGLTVKDDFIEIWKARPRKPSKKQPALFD